MPASLKIAVLDDYQGLSEQFYKALDPSSFEVSIFRDTLLPYNHPDTPQDVRDQLVKRLEPYTVICEETHSSRPFFLLHLTTSPINTAQVP